LIASSEDITGLALVVGAAEEIPGIRQLLVDSILGSAVPEDREGTGLLDHRTEGQTDACRHNAHHAVHPFLLNELLEALNRVLRRRLLFDHELDLAAPDPSAPVEAIHGPFGRAQSGDPGAGSNTRAWREHADLERTSLRDSWREDTGRSGGSACSCNRFQNSAA
jgi:hypothetical protein